jgi:peptidyl-prolyl cis-trans isomerase B (cyclophilin B)
MRMIANAIKALALAGLLACGEEHPPAAAVAPATPGGQPVPAASAPRPVAVLDVAGFGKIRIELLPDVAPQASAQFERLAREGFYDGTTFHRVIPGFVIQGGDPLSKDRDPRNDGNGNADRALPDELSALGHARGIVSMANTGRPDSGSCQFFIVLADHPELDGHYTVFGHVVAGMDVVDRIAAVERDVYGRYGPPDRPRDDVVVRSVRIEAGGAPASAVDPTATHG